MLLKLFKALTQCVTIILIGCPSRRLALFSPSEAAGIFASLRSAAAGYAESAVFVCELLPLRTPCLFTHRIV